MNTSSSLSFDPTQITSASGKTFDVAVNIFTDKAPSISTDVYIHYNADLIEPVLPVKASDTYSLVDGKIMAPGKLYLYGIRQDKTTASAANGTIATVTFRSKKEGQTQLTFECSRFGQSSQIITNNASLDNIINCDRTTSHTTAVVIRAENVLGISDTKHTTNMWYLTATVMVLIMTAILFMKYRKLVRK